MLAQDSGFAGNPFCVSLVNINTVRMNEQQPINYKRIAEAIDYLQQHFQSQPSLVEVAEKVQLSPFHFQRMFTEWAGTSPKKFLQYISIEYAKRILKDDRATLFDAAYETG